MESALSNDELALLAGLEESEPKATKKKPTKKKLKDFDEDTASFAMLRDLCEDATRLAKESYGESGCKDFEVIGNVVLPYVDGTGNENFVGTENLTFVKLIPSRHKGGILAVFALNEPRPNVAIWLQNLNEVFGKRGEQFVAFLNGPAIKLDERRQRIIDEAYVIDHAAVYEGNQEYGAW